MAEEVKGADKPSPSGKAFTAKSILFGIFGILIVAGFAYFNDNRLGQSLMIGNHFPIGAFFFIFCVALFWNWGASKLMPKLALGTGEMAVTLAMTLAACWTPTSGLYRYFHRLLVLPWYYLPQKPLWIKTGVLNYLPAKLFPLGDSLPLIIQKTLAGNLSSLDPSLKALYEDVYTGFVLGMQKGDQIVWNFPLTEWLAPMLYWGPMLMLFAACTVGLALLVHRQWAHHEQLSYPLASIASSLIKTKPGDVCSEIFSHRLFWWGLCPVLAIYSINYLSLWFPGSLPYISLGWDYWDGLHSLFPILKQSGSQGAQTGALFFTIVGICYFIPSEVGLSMGLSVFILAFAGAQFYMITGMPIPGQDLGNFRTGAYIGYALILLYTGRTYYFPVALKALGIGKKQFQYDAESVLAARVFMLGFAGMTAMLVVMGLNWLMALAFMLLLMLLFLVFTRVICETGIPFLQAGWLPGVFMVEFLGPAAVGAGPMAFVFYLGAILCQDPRECLMPYASTGFKVADDNSVGRRRLLIAMLASIAVALLVGFVVTLWTIYNFGALSFDNWANDYPPKMYFDKAAKNIAFLDSTGQLAGNDAEGPVERLSCFKPGNGVMSWTLAGAVCVVLLSVFRFRFSKCPIHPVLFLVVGTFPIGATYASFLIGWAVKQLVVKFGGGKAYQDLKPLFIGMIMGELIAGGVSILVGFIYYMATGLLPVALRILPG